MGFRPQVPEPLDSARCKTFFNISPPLQGAASGNTSTMFFRVSAEPEDFSQLYLRQTGKKSDKIISFSDLASSCHQVAANRLWFGLF